MKPSIFNCVMKCFDMKKKLLKSSQAMLMMILAGIAIISASSFSIDEAMAFPHASLIIDPEDEHANDIQIILGHTNEPAFGKLPGIHDGKHNLEVELSDAATTLPIQEANITADKYYFKDLKSFQRAQSLDDGDAIQKNVTVSAVFGQPGTFYNRQVIDPGIYGYTIRGTINYYDVALVPFEATKFCSIPGEDLTKFDTPDSWTGSFGCPQNIKSIFFPPASMYSDNYYQNTWASCGIFMPVARSTSWMASVIAGLSHGQTSSIAASMPTAGRTPSTTCLATSAGSGCTGV